MNETTNFTNTESPKNSNTEYFGPATRRGMFAGLGAAIAGASLMASPGQASGADSRLIELCREHAAISRRYNALFSEHGHDDAGREVSQRPLKIRQEEIEAVTWKMRATTPEGFRARAKMILAWSPAILSGPSSDAPDPEMVLALLRDLTA